MKKSIILFILSLFVGSVIGFSQAPTDNPYYSKYGDKDHWTDQFPWDEVTNASDVPGLIDPQKKVDSTVLHKTMKSISNKGGGVLFFPQGEYFLDYKVVIPENVVIRGADPVGITDAKNSGFRPPTRFEFPEYKPSFEGDGTPNSTAFKHIESELNASIGVVNLDLNRGLIWVPKTSKSNFIVLGVRSNNAVDFRTIFLASSKHRKWQKYPMADKGCIMGGADNAVIANCRINDAITDDYEMPDFLSNEGYVFKDVKVKFQYGMQPGISIWAATDSSNLELRDNYVKAFNASKIASYFNGRKIVRDNQLEFLPCQDLINDEFYSKKIEQHTAGAYGKEQYFIKDGDTLRYLLLMPENYDPAKKYPLFVFLHGIGQHGEKNPLVHVVGLFANDSIRKKYPYFVIVPHIDPEESFSAPFEEPATKALRMSAELTKEVKEKYSIDEDRTLVGGVSSGANATTEMVVRFPGIFKTAVVMSGARYLNNKQLKRIKDVNFIISTGVEDEKLPLEYVKTDVSNLRKNGNKVEFFEYEGVGHRSWLNMGVDEIFLNMIFK